MPAELLLCAESEDYTLQHELTTYVERIRTITHELRVEFVRAERLGTQIVALQERAVVEGQIPPARMHDARRVDGLEHELAGLYEERERSKAAIEELQSDFAFTQLIIDAIVKDVLD